MRKSNTFVLRSQKRRRWYRACSRTHQAAFRPSAGFTCCAKRSAASSLGSTCWRPGWYPMVPPDGPLSWLRCTSKARGRVSLSIWRLWRGSVRRPETISTPPRWAADLLALFKTSRQFLSKHKKIVKTVKRGHRIDAFLPVSHLKLSFWRSPSLHGHGEKWWPTEVTSNTYFRALNFSRSFSPPLPPPVADGDPRLHNRAVATRHGVDRQHDHQLPSANAAQSVPVQECQFTVQDAPGEDHEQSSVLWDALWAVQARDRFPPARPFPDAKVRRHYGANQLGEMLRTGLHQRGLSSLG